MKKSQKLILIAEDEKPMAKALELKLNHAGYLAKAVNDGEQAIQELTQTKYDLLLLDLVMPKMDGLTMLKHLREDLWGKDAKVLILTNLDENTKVFESMRKGVYNYLVKSDWTLKDLVDKVKSKL